jgi:eukaryotic-like serine/threonine-protein kinase
VKQVAFGKYTLHHRIARGGMAELFLARFAGRSGGDQLVVIKLVSSRYAEDLSFTSMFQDEVRIAATLNHPNIGQVLDVGEVAGNHFLAMEYIHGKDLRTLAGRCLTYGSPVPTFMAARIGAEICAGLHHAHEVCGAGGEALHIVHRDVSLSNIMVSYEGQVKLIDFGIAKAANRSTLTLPGTIKGKARYLSPEQIMGQPIDRRSDIFTLATSLWEVTVGQHLFDGKMEAHIYEAIAKGRVRRPSSLVADYPPELERILLKALSTRPEDRYVDARQMQGELDRFITDKGLRITREELARFMQEVFGDELSAWQIARARGANLLEHLMTLAEPEEHRHDLDDVLSLEDEKITHPDSEVKHHPAVAPTGSPTKEEMHTPQGPRKTILYGAHPDSPVGPVPEPAPRIEPVQPSPQPAPRAEPPDSALHHRVSASKPLAITPDGIVKVLSSDPLTQSSPRRDDDRRPTVIADASMGPILPHDTRVDADLAFPLAKTFAPTVDTPQVAPYESTAQNPKPIKIADGPPPDPTLDPIIGRDRLELEQKREQHLQQKKTKVPTGDWSHQATSKGHKRAGTHPFFSFFREVARTITPDSELDEEFLYPKRTRLVGLLGAGALVVVLGVTLFFLLRTRPVTHSEDKESKTRATAAVPVPAPQAAGVELLSEPTGATVYDAVTGHELGKTPLQLAVSTAKKVEIRLDGYKSAIVVLQSSSPQQKITLQREAIPALSPAHRTSPSRGKKKGERGISKNAHRSSVRKKFEPQEDHDSLLNPFKK